MSWSQSILQSNTAFPIYCDKWAEKCYYLEFNLHFNFCSSLDRTDLMEEREGGEAACTASKLEQTGRAHAHIISVYIVMNVSVVVAEVDARMSMWVGMENRFGGTIK